jgi:hypothetical protein
VRGNTILKAVPINFWNANHPLEQVGRNQLTWKSNTTGGVSGVILTLEKPHAGLLEIETPERLVKAELASVGLEPIISDCGGLRKKIEIYRLPQQQQSNEFSSALPLTALGEGDNPIFVRMTQEDGHMAWTSPIYVLLEQNTL